MLKFIAMLTRSQGLPLRKQDLPH